MREKTTQTPICKEEDEKINEVKENQSNLKLKGRNH